MGDMLMSEKEVERLQVFQQAEKGRISLMQAAKTLRLSYRHTKRLFAKYKHLGKNGLISQKRGKASNRRLSSEIEERVIERLTNRYYDFGPTFAAEKLLEECQIKVSRETVRKLAVKAGTHQPRKAKNIRVHQRRIRMACEGELVQIDGSPHAWFEERAPKCVLLLAVDDATSNVLAGRFEKSETTAGYFRLMKQCIEKHGMPKATYSDRHQIFRSNHGRDRNKTQFHRAMDELLIEVICAYSPEAKGRVERKNGVLQDRLIKELRLKGISSIEEANAFLPDYFKKHNARFGHPPAHPHNAYRMLNQTLQLDHVLCEKETRQVSKQLEIQYKRKILQLNIPGRERSLQHKRVVVIEAPDGKILLEYKGKTLDYKIYEEQVMQPEVLDSKELAIRWDKSSRPKNPAPSADHPWRQWPLKQSNDAHSTAVS
jgi:transposase